MKIDVSKLQANPFRNIKHYPMNEDKIKMLMESMEQTTFWDNILARKSNGGYQIAYGHHRLEALKRIGILEVDIPVRNLNDARMLQIMAQENREEYGTTPAVINETVRATRDFLLEHPEESAAALPRHADGIARESDAISGFLQWPLKRVQRALADIHAAESGEVAKEAIQELPTQEHSAAFRKGVREAKKIVGEDKTLPKPVQKKIAREVKKAHEKGEPEGTAQRTTEKVVAAFAKEHSTHTPDAAIVDQVIDEDRVRKLTKRLNDVADEIQAIKDVKYVPMHLVGSLEMSMRKVVTAIEDIHNE